MNPSTNATACPTIAASASALGTAAGHQQQHSRPTRGPSPPAPHISSLAPASSSDSVLVEAFSPAHLAMTETGPSSSNNDPAVSYPWQMGTMSCLHRRSSCSTLDSFSVARDSNTIGSHIGDNGDNTSAISDTFGNPFQFSLCPANTAWAASHLESGSGYIPPRPVSAPSLTTTAIAQDNGLSRAADNGMGSHSNSYIITTAPLDSTITSCSILPDTVDSGLSDLAMPPSSLPILAVSAIPDLPGITSASDLRAGSGASTWSNNVWSLATTAGLTSVPLGCDTMEFEGGLDDLKQSDLTDKTQKLLHQTQLLQQFQASLADLRQLGIGMQELDHREDKSSWRLPFEATKSTYSGMSFSHPGSTYSSSLPSSSGVSSPESSSAAAVFCGLPTLRENSLHMPMDEQQSQEYSLPAPFLPVAIDGFEDFLDYSACFGTEEKPRGLVPTAEKVGGETALPLPTPHKCVTQAVTPAVKSKHDGTSLDNGTRVLSATQTPRSSSHVLDVVSRTASGCRTHTQSETGEIGSAVGAAPNGEHPIARPMTSADGIGVSDYSKQGAGSCITDSPASASEQLAHPCGHDQSPQLLRTTQLHLTHPLPRRHQRLSSATQPRLLPSIPGYHRPMTSVSTSESRHLFFPPRSATDQQVLFPSSLQGTPLIGVHRRKSPSDARSATMTALNTTVGRDSSRRSPVQYPGLLHPVPQRRPQFNMNDSGGSQPLLSRPSALGAAQQYTITPCNASQSTNQVQQRLQSVPLLRRHAPPSPPFRSMYGQVATSPSSTDKATAAKRTAFKQEGMADTAATLISPLPQSMLNGNTDGQVSQGTDPLVTLDGHTEVSNYPRSAKRAAVACTPCRQTKRKCDGGSPCSACVRRKYPRGGPCEYVPPAPRSRPGKEGSLRKAILAEQKRLKEEEARKGATEGTAADSTSCAATTSGDVAVDVAGSSPAVATTQRVPTSPSPNDTKLATEGSGPTMNVGPHAPAKAKSIKKATLTTASQYPTLSALLDTSRFTTAPMTGVVEMYSEGTVASSSSSPSPSTLLPPSACQMPKALYTAGAAKVLAASSLATTGANRAIRGAPADPAASAVGLVSSASAGSTMGQCR